MKIDAEIKALEDGSDPFCDSDGDSVYIADWRNMQQPLADDRYLGVRDLFSTSGN